MPNTLPPDRIWRDPEVRRIRTEKRYNEMLIDGGGDSFRLGTALNLVLALEEARNTSIPGLKAPFCILHGTEDAAVPIAGSEFLIEHAATPEADRQFHRVRCRAA